MNAVQKLRQTLNDLRTPVSPGKAGEHWALAQRLLGRMPADQEEVARVCESRDLEGLDSIIAKLEAPATPSASVTSIPDEELDRAMRAYKKRLKVMRLADESKLGGRQLTGGRQSEIDAIIPPTEFPRDVWVALAHRGDLKDAGGGFYAPRG